jgi:hypothetical protein
MSTFFSGEILISHRRENAIFRKPGSIRKCSLSLSLSIIGSYYVSKAGLLNTGAENSLLPYGASFVL